MCWCTCKTNLLTERFITHFTYLRTFSTVYALMCLNLTHMTEWFFTHITWIQMLPSAYAVMIMQNTNATEWLGSHHIYKGHSPLRMRWCTIRQNITLNDLWHITWKRTLSTAYVLFLQMTLLTEWFETLITCIRTLPCVCADVPSNDPIDWMIWNTHHIHKDAPHCVYVNES